MTVALMRLVPWILLVLSMAGVAALSMHVRHLEERLDAVEIQARDKIETQARQSVELATQLSLAREELAEAMAHEGAARQDGARLKQQLRVAEFRWAHVAKSLCEEVMRSREPARLAAVSEVLGNFRGAPSKVRKDIVYNIVGRYNELYSRSEGAKIDPTDLNSKAASKLLAAISDKWNAALARLTGQRFDSLPDWRRWWNTNKGRDWDEDRH